MLTAILAWGLSPGLALGVSAPTASQAGEGSPTDVAVRQEQGDVVPDTPWLSPPWRLERVTAASRTALEKDFCGVAAALGSRPEGQALSNGPADVRIHAVTTVSFARAADIFKRLYSECAAITPVTSAEGPALYWQVEGSATRSAALWSNSTVFLVAATSKGAAARPDLPAVVADLQRRVGTPCRASDAGKACPPTPE